MIDALSPELEAFERRAQAEQAARSTAPEQVAQGLAILLALRNEARDAADNARGREAQAIREREEAEDQHRLACRRVARALGSDEGVMP